MFKVCRQCGSEFQSWVSVCTDCNIPLELPPGEVLAGDERTRGQIGDAVVLRFDSPAALVEIAEALQERGFWSEIGPHPKAGPRLALFVNRADAEAARLFVEELITLSMPEVQGAVDYGPGACPACGEPMSDDAASCSACGLEFPEIEPDPGTR